jgi:hypothetical protein
MATPRPTMMMTTQLKSMAYRFLGNGRKESILAQIDHHFYGT